MKIYTVGFGDHTKHKCCVFAHSSIKALRKYRSKIDREKARNVLAFCHIPDGHRNNHICDLHFALDELSLWTIVHECIHAATQRTEVLGASDEDWNKETICTDTEKLAKQVTQLLMPEICRIAEHAGTGAGGTKGRRRSGTATKGRRR